MLDAVESGSFHGDLRGFLLDDPMAIDPAYFFDAPRMVHLQSRRGWLHGEETLSNEVWQEDGEELFDMPFPRITRSHGFGSRRTQIAYPYPWLAEPEG